MSTTVEMLFGALCLFALASANAVGVGSGAASGAVSSSSSSSSGGTTGQGVNYGTTNGYTGSATYSPGYPYKPVTTQQYSTQFYPNSNYPNNANYQQSQNFQNPNQFQNPYQFQNQFQQFPFIPFSPFQFGSFFPAPFTPPQYQQAFTQFQNSLQQQIASGASFTHSTPGSNAYALSSLGPANLYNQQQQSWNQLQNGGGGGNSAPYYAPNFAAATATYGGNGIHQTASVYPPNPNSENIDNRFGASGPNDGNGFFGVSTASFSTSSDVNGIKSNRQGAITSVNDNGKVTTYKVNS